MKTNSMRKILDSKVFWLIVSLLLSLTIWIYVKSGQEDTITLTFRGVPVTIVGEDVLRESRNLVITDRDVSSVTVQISGPRRVVNSLSAENLSAVVDVRKLMRSTYTSLAYSINFPDSVDTTDLKVVYKTPETVSFVVSELVRVQIPVRGSFEGSLADGFTAEAPSFEPSTITVSGAKVYVDNVSYAWVNFGEENISNSYTMNVPFTLCDESGNTVSTEGLTLSDETVVATLPVMAVKDVPLIVKLVYGAGATEDNTKVEYSVNSITLAGDTSILSSMNQIVLKTIDLTDFTTNYTATFPISYDDSLTNMSGETECTVNIEIVGLQTKSFDVIPENINASNIPSGYSCDIVTQSMNVVLRGPLADLDEVVEENITVVADLSDYSGAGSYVVPAKVYVNGFPNVDAIGKSNISITLRKDT